MNKTVAITAAVAGTVGLGVGSAITYLTVNKALRTRYEDWANEQIDDVKRRYAAMNEDVKRSILDQAMSPSPDILAAVKEGNALLKSNGYVPTDDAPHESAQVLSIWDRGVADPDEIDPEDEVDDPRILSNYEIVEGEPYLISAEEYFENEWGHELDTLTYYEMDDTLTDEKNERIDRVQETVGVRHLHMFPKVKGDEKRSIYVRNEDHDSLYEVICIEESYAMNILGMTEEELGYVEPKVKIKKMKRDDD